MGMFDNIEELEEEEVRAPEPVKAPVVRTSGTPHSVAPVAASKPASVPRDTGQDSFTHPQRSKVASTMEEKLYQHPEIINQVLKTEPTQAVVEIPEVKTQKPIEAPKPPMDTRDNVFKGVRIGQVQEVNVGDTLSDDAAVKAKGMVTGSMTNGMRLAFYVAVIAFIVCVSAFGYNKTRTGESKSTKAPQAQPTVIVPQAPAPVVVAPAPTPESAPAPMVEEAKPAIPVVPFVIAPAPAASQTEALPPPPPPTEELKSSPKVANTGNTSSSPKPTARKSSGAPKTDNWDARINQFNQYIKQNH